MDFYDRIFNYRTRYDSFIAIPIYNEGDTVKYVVENHSLYNYMAGGDKNSLKYDSYKNNLKELLLKGQGIKASVSSEELQKKWHFHKVIANDKVDSVAKLGKENFITYFFTSRSLKDGITPEEKNAIIYQLFTWQIASNINDETGYLYIYP
ncbi:hypothetical protein DN068_16135 [Taibaiella soli]|uniref:Uncharacterized protein n=2 Tax=Taibaiella soli TaxID=1649169 RepID=A0A2W2BUV7_9BACT|nr:hypothetical protein DN068_16135 [Taibaiella soli]